MRGWQFEAGELAPGGLLGVHARDVRLEEHAGLAIPIDEVTASLRVLPLLIGRQVLVFDGRVYEGRVRGHGGALRRRPGRLAPAWRTSTSRGPSR